MAVPFVPDTFSDLPNNRPSKRETKLVSGLPSIRDFAGRDRPAVSCTRGIADETDPSASQDGAGGSFLVRVGGMLCVFEHDDDQPAWFTHFESSTAMCSGKATRLVSVDGLLAATWPAQKRRHITVIGATDVDEVARLVTHFEQSAQTVRE